MFDNLTDRLSRTLRNIRPRTPYRRQHQGNAARSAHGAAGSRRRVAGCSDFINRVKEKAVGHEVNKSLTPGQEFVKIVRNELVSAMGEENRFWRLSLRPSC